MLVLHSRVLALTCLIFAQSGVAEAAPVAAWTQADETVVRSGPDESYYTCGELPAGKRIEVYRSVNGWGAIRPPKGNFSLVDRRFLREIEDGLAEITVDQAVSHIAGMHGEEFDVYQVRLREGELVRLAPEQPDARWFRIEPPAGEFRWVRLSDLTDREPPIAPGGDLAPIPPPRIETPASEPASLPRRDADASVPDEFDASNALDIHSSTARQTSQDDGSAPDAPSIAPPRNQRAQIIDYSAELTAINLDLARTVTATPRQWRLADLANRAAIVEKHAEHVLLRAKASALSQRIARFQAIQDGLTALDETAPRNAPWKVAAAIPSDNENETFAANGVLRGGYDRATRRQRYWLETMDGGQTVFLEPPVGLELRRYLGQRLGVTGRRTQSLEDGRANVAVERITSLPRNPALR